MSYYQSISHEGLNKHKVITGRYPEVVEAKAIQQLEAWDREWEEKQRKAAKIATAAERTQQAKNSIDLINTILHRVLDQQFIIRVDDLKDTSTFSLPYPIRPRMPLPPAGPKFPQEPILYLPPPPLEPILPQKPELYLPPPPDEPTLLQKSKLRLPQYLQQNMNIIYIIDIIYIIVTFFLTLINKLTLSYSTAKYQQKVEDTNREYTEAIASWKHMCEVRQSTYKSNCAHYQQQVKVEKLKYTQAIADWKQNCAKIQATYDEARLNHSSQVRKITEEYEAMVARWSEKEKQFKIEQQEFIEFIEQKMNDYANRIPSGVNWYFETILDKIQDPAEFQTEWEVDYNNQTGTIVVEYALPKLAAIPSLKEVRYVQSRDEYTEVMLSERDKNRMYDNLLYQLSLRTIHMLFAADARESLASVVFNGWVTDIDKATGQQYTACILSIHVTRKEYDEIDLATVDPKECFKSLKGVGAAQLHQITPVAPVMQINKEDSRFVSSYAVTQTLDDSYNLAAMDWEDFEHLIRELFEQEFSSVGGDVKITRASRDGGVDAVIFDPDPIHGGKIVIQAKRYTNTVGVSAVRDLYGTLVNEGANKGILVSTSDFGVDAHGFAKGKPIVLINGANLLHLLAKHGHKAKIDINEAKQFLAEQDRHERNQ